MPVERYVRTIPSRSEKTERQTDDGGTRRHEETRPGVIERVIVRFSASPIKNQPKLCFVRGAKDEGTHYNGWHHHNHHHHHHPPWIII